MSNVKEKSQRVVEDDTLKPSASHVEAGAEGILSNKGLELLQREWKFYQGTQRRQSMRSGGRPWMVLVIKVT